MTPITDEELFDGVQASALPANAPPLDKAKLVIEILSGAMLQLPFGVNLDSAEQLWAIELAEFDPVDLVNACRDYIDRGEKDFPPVGVVTALARESRRTRHYGDPDTNCATCTNNRFVPSDPEADGTSNVMPCADCNPVRREWVLQGHARPTHTRASCEHELCQPPKRKARR